MSLPLLTVIVPVYNVQDYLHSCINSILSQDYPNMEIILIDDGSSDNSGIICDEFAAQDNRICSVHLENHGVSHARNIGIEKAGGEFITFVDSDDFLKEGIYRYCIEKMINDEVNMATFDADYYYTSTKIQKKNLWMEYDNIVVNNSEELFYKIFRRSGWVYNKIFSSGIIKRIRFDEAMTYGEDVYFVLQVLKQTGIKCYVSNKSGYVRRMRNDSVTAGGLSKKNIEYLENNIKIYDQLSTLNYASLGVYRIYIAVHTLIRDMVYSNSNDSYYLQTCKKTLKHPQEQDIKMFYKDRRFSIRLKANYITMSKAPSIYYMIQKLRLK